MSEASSMVHGDLQLPSRNTAWYSGEIRSGWRVHFCWYFILSVVSALWFPWPTGISSTPGHASGILPFQISGQRRPQGSEGGSRSATKGRGGSTTMPPSSGKISSNGRPQRSEGGSRPATKGRPREAGTATEASLEIKLP